MRELAIAGVAPAPVYGGLADAVREVIARGLILLAVAFTNVGTGVLTNRMIAGGTAPTRIGWGTGTTAAAVTQTDLVTETTETLSAGRVAGTESRVTTTNTNDTYQVAGTVTATGTRAITEYGQFDANSSGATVPNATGNMFIRSNFSAVNVVSGDSIAFTSKLQIVSNAV